MRLHTVVARIPVVLLLVTMAFARQMSAADRLATRYVTQWQVVDSLAIIADCAVLTLVTVGLTLLIDRVAPRAARRLYPGALLLGMTVAALSIAQRLRVQHPTVHGVAWLIGAAAAAYAVGNPTSRLVWLARKTCLVLSPLPAILFLQLMLIDSWGVSATPLRPIAGAADAHGPPVFFFVFDEWSYQRSFERSDWRPFFANLRDVSRQAVVFHHALSPGRETAASLPMLIYGSRDQRAIPRALVDGKLVNSVSAAFGDGPPSSPSSLFAMVKGQHYGTVLLGFYLPYQRMLGSEVDRYRVYSIPLKGHTFAESMILKGVENLRYGADPVSQRYFRLLYTRMVASQWAEVNASLNADVLKSIELFPAQTLLFVHYPLPHAPFIFEPDGRVSRGVEVNWDKARTAEEDLMLGNPEDYERHLRRLDNVIGGIVDRLRQTGKFEDALVIFTSDHSWRNDPGLDRVSDDVRRVPLLVKLPHQRVPWPVDTEFEASRLKGLVASVIEGRCNVEQIARCLEMAR